MNEPVGEDADPLNDRCDACGAGVAEDCFPGCIGYAQMLEREGSTILGRTTDDEHVRVWVDSEGELRQR